MPPLSSYRCSNKWKGSFPAFPTVLDIVEQEWEALYLRIANKASFLSAAEDCPHPWHNHLLTVFLEILSRDVSRLEKSIQINELEQEIQGWILRLEKYAASQYEGTTFLLAGQIASSLKKSLEEVARIRRNSRPPHPADDFTTPEDESILLQKKRSKEKKALVLSYTLNNLADKKDEYLNIIKQDGFLDPALAVLVVFLQNYSSICRSFNERWSQSPLFYRKTILQTRPRPPLQSKAWLQLAREDGASDFILPAGTRFPSGEKADGTPLYCRSIYDVEVNGWELEKMISLSLDNTVRPPVKLLSPLGKKSFMTAWTRNHLTPADTFAPRVLFGGGEDVESGWMLETPILRLQEGTRTVQCRFLLTRESQKGMEELLHSLTRENPLGPELKIRFFDKAFLCKVSTEDGWLKVENTIKYHLENGSLILEVHLPPEAPSTACCTSEVHGCNSEEPVLQAVMNPGAWMYPYSWASEIIFESLTVRCLVSGVSSLHMGTGQGEIDSSAPFNPFVPCARPGTRLLFGSPEMAAKPLKHVHLTCRWQQLPSEEGGFSEYYGEYSRRPDNYSFQVIPQWLRNGVWEQGDGTPVSLFSAESANGMLYDHSVFSFSPQGETIPFTTKEDGFVLHSLRNGLLCLLFHSPAEGFFENAYRDQFTRTLISNSRTKKQKPLPHEPISPLMFDVRVDYEAQEEWRNQSNGKTGKMRFSYLHPFDTTRIISAPAGVGRPFILPLEEQSLLLFAFKNAEGGSGIRLFADFTMKEDLPSLKKDSSSNESTQWSYWDHHRWQKLADEQIVENSTREWTRSGIISLLLPEPVQKSWLDDQGLFWLIASVPHPEKCRTLNALLLNPVEVIAEGGDGAPLPPESISAADPPVPGLLSVSQILPGHNGRPTETEERYAHRIAHRITHRNRALTARDYEQLILDEFPEMERVLCLPTGEDASPGSVKLVLVRNWNRDEPPLCSERLLDSVRDRLLSCTSPFARISVQNPVYEKVTIHCHVELRGGTQTGETLRRLKRKINAYIAPWLVLKEPPAFLKNLSWRGICTIIGNDEGVSRLYSLHFVYPPSSGDRLLILPPAGTALTRDSLTNKGKDYLLTPAHGSGIFIPAANHLIKFQPQGSPENPEQDAVGMGDLEIGETFIIP